MNVYGLHKLLSKNVCKCANMSKMCLICVLKKTTNKCLIINKTKNICFKFQK